MISDDESREIFREEALDLLTELEGTLLELEHRPDDLDLVNGAFRALHTIKGSGAMFGFDAIAEFTHSLENVFDKIRNGGLRVTSPLISLTFAARDHILAMLNGPDEKDDGTPERGREILTSVRELLNPDAPSASVSSPSDAPSADPQQEAVAGDSEVDGEGESGDAPPSRRNAAPGGAKTWRIDIRARDPQIGREVELEDLFRSLRELGPCTVRAQTDDLPDLPELEPQTLYLSWVVELTTSADTNDIRDLFFFTDVDLDVDFHEIEGPSSGATQAEKGGAPDAPAEHLVAEAKETARKPTEAAEPEQRRLGEILVEDGVIDKTDLRRALQQQQKSIAGNPVEHGPSPSKLERSAGCVPQREVVASLRVAADKLDKLVDLVGELVIVQAQISQLVSRSGDAQLKTLSEQLERLSADLRDSTLGIRMLPIGSTFSKYRRLVRDLSKELGKSMELVTQGEETELDKTVLERLGDPLVHLLRNSMDHGIESPEERRAAGKRACGTIILAAEHSGSEVLIRITDDGRGMDPAALCKKAAERGLIAPETELTDQEAFNLIFQPGFSMADKVTNISGRGVGMDVVHRAIDALRGAIEIRSEKGKGTSITIRLPLTLAIIEGLQVQVGGGFYVIPLSLVEECVELCRADMDESGRQRIINLRGELVPYIHLRRWFEMPGRGPDIEQIVITGVEGRRIGIVMDKVIGEHQTVIKSLGRVYRDVEGISGATIRGDGSLALILDVPRLVRSVVAERA